MSEPSMDMLKFLACCVALLIFAIPTTAFVFAVSVRLFGFIYDRIDEWLEER
jgi:hypothetical protein